MSEDNTLFVGEGRPSELDALLLSEALGPGPARGSQDDLAVPFREPSYFSIGDPIVSPLASIPELPRVIREQFGRYDFHQVQLACSLQPAPGCRFTDARFSVELMTEWDAGVGTADAVEDAIAYDLFPQLIEDPTILTITSSVKPEVSFKFEPVSATLAVPSRERIAKRVSYAARVVAFDLQGRNPAWQFQRTDQHELSGPQRLFMVVRKPKGSMVRAAFSLRARVEFRLGGQGLSPVDLVMLFRRRNRSGTLIEDPSVALC